MTVLCGLPIQYISKLLSKRLYFLLAFGLTWHHRLSPDQHNFDLIGLCITSDNVARNGSRKEMLALLLDHLESLEQLLLLTSSYMHENRRHVLRVLI